MHSMSKYKFRQYEVAADKLKELRQQHAMELQYAYDSINPTMTHFDYSLGRVYAASVDPSDYAIYLVELREEHEKVEKYWFDRAEAYKKAVDILSDAEKDDLFVYKSGNYANHQKARNKVLDLLTEIAAADPNLKVNANILVEDTEEYDKHIDSLPEEELFEDYWSLDEQLEEEGLKDKCINLYTVNDMTFKEISESIGITSTRARQIVSQANY